MPEIVNGCSAIGLVNAMLLARLLRAKLHFLHLQGPILVIVEVRKPALRIRNEVRSRVQQEANCQVWVPSTFPQCRFYFGDTCVRISCSQVVELGLEILLGGAVVQAGLSTTTARRPALPRGITGRARRAATAARIPAVRARHRCPAIHRHGAPVTTVQDGLEVSTSSPQGSLALRLNVLLLHCGEVYDVISTMQFDLTSFVTFRLHLKNGLGHLQITTKRRPLAR
mmetsp:Transcript_71043/g.170194  ORF Transcript_71043/g.170194 Transcript_71043/m.170194 type:complete len:226 (-) Transcript_71043:71-748(-)